MEALLDFLKNLNLTKNSKKLQNKKHPWNFLQSVLKCLECAFVMFFTSRKILYQKLEGRTFKVPYNSHRDCLKKSLICLALLFFKLLKILLCIFMWYLPHVKDFPLIILRLLFLFAPYLYCYIYK